MRIAAWRSGAVALGLFLAALGPGGKAAGLTEAEARKRFEEILPPASETGWMKIQWRNTVKQAVVDANAQDKPILLYQMRGHPLGAT